MDTKQGMIEVIRFIVIFVMHLVIISLVAVKFPIMYGLLVGIMCISIELTFCRFSKFDYIWDNFDELIKMFVLIATIFAIGIGVLRGFDWIGIFLLVCCIIPLSCLLDDIFEETDSYVKIAALPLLISIVIFSFEVYDGYKNFNMESNFEVVFEQEEVQEETKIEIENQMEIGKEDINNITYVIEEDVITLTAPDGYTVTKNAELYIIKSSGIQVTSISAEGNVLNVYINGDGMLFFCEGLFENGELKSESFELDPN